MLGASSRTEAWKAAIAALAVLYAVAALSILATATPAGGRRSADGGSPAVSLEQHSLGR